MLGQIPRPGMSTIAGSDAIFWKTGTSQGFHDAWSVAVFDHYVLAVWVGNFDGKSNPAFVGRSCAAPLLFQVVDAMRATGRARARPHEPPPNANLRRVEFCAVSGELPTAACTHRVTGWFIPGVSPISQCEIHREILIDDATGLRVQSDDGTRKLHREVYEFWPSDLLALFEQAGLPRRDAAAVFARQFGRSAFPPRPRAAHCLAEEQCRLFVRRRRRRSRAFPAGRDRAGRGESLLVRRSRLSRHERSRHAAFVAAETGQLQSHRAGRSRPLRFLRGHVRPGGDERATDRALTQSAERLVRLATTLVRSVGSKQSRPRCDPL